MTTTRRRSGLIAPDRVDDVFDKPGSLRAIAVLRVVLGPVVVLHLWPDVTAAWDGDSYLDHFNEPWFSFLPQIPAWVQYGLVHVGVVAAVAMMLGWRIRLVAPLTAACVTGNMFLSQTHFRHNRAFLILLLWTVAISAVSTLSKCPKATHSPTSGPTNGGGDDRLWGQTGGVGELRDEVGTLWPMWTMRVLASSVYFASGFSKLIDPDWVGGLVLWDRSVRYQHAVTERVPGVLGEWLVDIITTRWVHAVASPIAVAMELFIAVGLWFARTRMAAVWVAVFFHLSIEASASVEVFSLAAIAALVIWTTPNIRDRLVTVPDGTWIRRLDWLARFEFAEGDGLSVVDRDGRVSAGRDAGWVIASRLPLTFMIAAPMVTVARWRRRRTDSSVP